MNVRQLTNSDNYRWDSFVDSMNDATLFHKTSWKRIIENTFHYESTYFFVEEDQQILAVLPLFYIKSKFVGKAFISTPFAVYGGIISASHEAGKLLYDFVVNMVGNKNADYLELRHFQSCNYSGLQTNNELYYTFKTTLQKDRNAILGAMPREARRLYRKATKLGLQSEFGNSRLLDFYGLYAKSLRQLGTPAFPKNLFRNCLLEFGKDAEILVVTHDRQPVSTVMAFYYKDTILPYYGGSDPDKRSLSSNNFMYVNLMEHAAQADYTAFDFGRSKVGTGAFAFKKHMGFEATPLSYQYYLSAGQKMPEKNPLNPKYKLAIQTWRRMPLGLTKLIGPRLIRHFP